MLAQREASASSPASCSPRPAPPSPSSTSSRDIRRRRSISRSRRSSRPSPPCHRGSPTPSARSRLQGTMASFVWTINGHVWERRKDIRHAAWPARHHHGAAAMMICFMAHAMHLHGHRFQVIGLEDKLISGAVRDTVLVPALGNRSPSRSTGTSCRALALPLPQSLAYGRPEWMTQARPRGLRVIGIGPDPHTFRKTRATHYDFCHDDFYFDHVVKKVRDLPPEAQNCPRRGCCYNLRRPGSIRWLS